jgi:hypothetical protein
MEGKKLELLKDSDHGPLSEVDPVCPLPVMSRKMKVWVSHVEGPDCLWLQRVCDADTIAELLEKMYMFYVTEGKGVNLETSEGKLCAAKSASDDQWYRGKILFVNMNDGTCTVLFIDCGNSETIPITHVKELDASLFTPHAQAICTMLAVEFDQNEQVTSELLDITADKEFTAVFGLRKENKWLVDLLEDGASISKKLVDLSLVKEFEAHLFQSELTVGTTHAVFVSHIDSPCSFWVQKTEDTQEILTLQEELTVAADMLENIKSPPPVGTKCIGMYAGAWYRAVVLESNLSLVMVHFIDYGNVEVIDISSGGLKPLPEKLQDIPGYAERCSLIRTCEFEFHVGAAEEMKVLVGSTEVPVTVDILSDGEVKCVDLCLSDGSSVLINLVVKGFATETGITDKVSAVETQSTEVSAVGAKISKESISIGTQVSEYVSAVFVSYIKSPSEFWIQYKSDASQIEEMENRLLKAKSFSVLNAVVEGLLCAAEFTDGQWYRAKVLQVTDGIKVFFLDYGNHSVVTELRSLPEDLISVPPLAKRCTLCLPNGVTEWPMTAKGKFIRRAGGGCTQFQVNIMEEGDCAVVSLLEGERKIEEYLVNMCPTVVEALTMCVKPSKLRASISHVISPSEFWIQLKNSLFYLDEISSQLVESEEFPILYDIEERVLCVAKFPEDGSWYRAQISSCGGDCLEVMYIDFGNTAVSTELRELPADLKNIPPLAKKCSLFIPSDISEWPETVNDAFVDIVGDPAKLFEIEIIRDGDPAVISVWYDGKELEEELKKIVETKKMEVVTVTEGETLTETCPDERKEGDVYNEEEAVKEETEDLSENDNVGQAKEQEEAKEEYSVKHFEDVNGLDMSEKQDKGIRDKVQDEIEQGKMEEKEEDTAKSISSFIEQDEQNYEHQVGEKVIVDNVQNTVNYLKDQLEDTACSGELISQETGEFRESISAENTELKSTKESTKVVASDSLNIYSFINNGDENRKGNISMENTQERSLELHYQKTQHTEKLIREINIEIKTPSEAVSKMLKNLYSERLVPASISRGLSEEELLDAVLNKSASPKLMHAEKIVPGCISQSRLTDTGKDDGIKSAPTTPLVSHSERFLHRVLSYDELGQRIPSRPKLTHNDRIVPGSISRGKSQEEIHPFTVKLPHAEKIVPGCISRSVANEKLECKQLQAAVTEAPEQIGEGTAEVD